MLHIKKLPLSTAKFLKFPYFVNFFVASILDRVPDLPDIKLCSGDNVKTAFRDGFFPDVSNDTLSGVNNF